MTYEEFKIKHPTATMSESEFDLFVVTFDAIYKAFAEKHGIYDQLLELFLLKNDPSNKITNATSRSVDGVSVSNTVTTETSINRFEIMFNDLLTAFGWGAKSTFNGFIVT